MTWSEFFSLISLLASATLCIISIYKLKRGAGWGFIWLNFCLSVWQGCKILYLHLGPTSEWFDFFSLLSFSGATGVAPSFFLLVNELSYSFSQRRKFWVKLSAFIYGILLVLIWSGQMISSPKPNPWGYLHEPQWAYVFFIVYFAWFMGWSFQCLNPKSLAAYPVVQFQNRLILVAASTGVFLGTFEIFSVLFFPVFPIANLSPLAFSGGLWWTVYRFNLLDSLSTLKRALGLFYWWMMCVVLSFILLLLVKKWSQISGWDLNLVFSISFGFLMLLVFKMTEPILKKWAPMTYLSSKELQEFQIELAKQTTAKGLYKNVLNLCAHYRYKAVCGTLLERSESSALVSVFDGMKDVPSFLMSTENSMRNQVLHSKWILQQLRVGRLSLAERKKHLSDLRFLRKLRADVWIPLMVDEKWWGAVWMAEPDFRFENLERALESIQALSASASAQLAHLYHAEAHRNSEQLNQIGLLTAALAHEIRNPLQTLLLSGDMLKERYPEERFVQLIQTESRRLEDLLALFLRWTKKVEVDLKMVELNTFLKEFYEREKLSLARLELVGLTEGKIELSADRILLAQILANLIRNADRHSENTSPIYLRLEILSYAVKIVVRDFGEGVQEPHKLFKPFYSTASNGHGLGLAFAQKMAQAMRGRLYYQAPEVLNSDTLKSSGSEFILELPLVC